MKIKNIVTIVMLSAITMGFSSCKGSDDDILDVKEVSELKINADEVRVVVGNKMELEVAKGNGDYKVFSLNPEIAEVKIENGKIIIEGKGSGKTSIIVSDQANLYKKLPVVSLYDKITVSQEVVDIKMLIGNPKLAKINVLSGNGGYTVISNNPDILSVKADNDVISVTANKEGKAILTIKDALDVVKEVAVNITTTDIAYDASELEAIKANSEARYVFGTRTIINKDNSWYTYYNKLEADLNFYGWNNYNRNYLKIYFGGDKSIGEKAGAKLTVKDSFTLVDQPIQLKVIKNDGTKIWAIYSCIKDNKLYFGHFCQNINQ